MRLAATLLFALSLAGCGTTPPPADPSALPTSTSDPVAADPSASPAPSADPAPASTEAPGLKSRTDNSIPDDYTMSSGDCASLAKKLGDLTRSDEVAKVPPKLNEKQKEKAMQSIDDAASKVESHFGDNCQNNLVGKVTDNKALKCALDSKSVKAFEVCLNGEAPAPKK